MLIDTRTDLNTAFTMPVYRPLAQPAWTFAPVKPQPQPRDAVLEIFKQLAGGRRDH